MRGFFMQRRCASPCRLHEDALSRCTLCLPGSCRQSSNLQAHPVSKHIARAQRSTACDLLATALGPSTPRRESGSGALCA